MFAAQAGFACAAPGRSRSRRTARPINPMNIHAVLNVHWYENWKLGAGSWKTKERHRSLLPFEDWWFLYCPAVSRFALRQGGTPVATGPTSSRRWARPAASIATAFPKDLPRPLPGFRASRSGGRDARPTASATLSHAKHGRGKNERGTILFPTGCQSDNAGLLLLFKP